MTEDSPYRENAKPPPEKKFRIWVNVHVSPVPPVIPRYCLGEFLRSEILEHVKIELDDWTRLLKGEEVVQKGYAVFNTKYVTHITTDF